MNPYRFENVCAWTNGFVFVMVNFWRSEWAPSHLDDGERLNTLCSERFMHTGSKLTETVDPLAICQNLAPDLPNFIRIEVRHGNQAVAITKV